MGWNQAYNLFSETEFLRALCSESHREGSDFLLSLAPGSEWGDEEDFWLDLHGRGKQAFRPREEGK